MELHIKISTGNSLGPLLNNALLETTSLGKGDLGSISSSNGEHVVQPSAEGVSLGILNGGNVEGSLVLLNVVELSDAPGVISAGDHDHGSDSELDDFTHLSSGNVYLDGIVGLDIGVGVTNGTSIMGDTDGDLVGRDEGLLDLAELVGSLFLGDTVEYKASLDIKEKTEDITALLKFDNVHESSGELLVGADLSVHLDTTLHANLLTFLSSEGILEFVTEDDSNGETLAFLVGTGVDLGCPDTSHLGEVPGAGRGKALEVLLVSVGPAKEEGVEGGGGGGRTKREETKDVSGGRGLFGGLRTAR